jgi:hypothetical protein
MAWYVEEAEGKLCVNHVKELSADFIAMILYGDGIKQFIYQLIKHLPSSHLWEGVS